MSKPKQRNEPVGVQGHWRLELYDKDGILKDVREAKNLVVNDGLSFLAEYLFLGGSPTYQPDPMNYVAVGTDATAVDAGNATLGSELFRQTYDTVTSAGVGVVSIETSIGAGDATGVIAECGVFNDSTAGTMLNRVILGGSITKGASDILKVVFTFTFTAS